MVKRVSTDEKLSKILEFFRSRADFFCIKDLEKALPKECPNVTSMLVPDLLKKLQDDNLINVEKMGISNVYWSFRSQPYHYYTCEIEKMQLAIDTLSADLEKKSKHLAEVEKTKEDSPEKTLLLETYSKFKEEFDRIERIKRQLSECSTAEYYKTKEEIEEFRAKANKATDDIFSLQSFICNKHGLDKKEFAQSFNIKEDMDYL